MDFTVKEDWRTKLKNRFAKQEEDVKKPWEQRGETSVEKDAGFLNTFAEIAKNKEKEADEVIEKLLEVGYDCIEKEKVLKAQVVGIEKMRKLYEEKIVKRAKKAVKEDEKFLGEARTIIQQLEDVTGPEFKRKIKDTFVIGFKGAGSRNIVVAESDGESRYGKPKVCIGPEGFQMRPYKQARPLHNFEEMQYIVSKRAEIVKSMKAKRNLKGLVTKFEAFCECMPEMIKGKQSVLPLGKDVMIPHREYDKLTPVKIIDRICFLNSQHINTVKKGDEFNSDMSYAMRYDEYMDWDDSVAYLQFRERIPELVARLKAETKPSLDKASDAIEKIQTLFSKELLLHNI